MWCWCWWSFSLTSMFSIIFRRWHMEHQYLMMTMMKNGFVISSDRYKTASIVCQIVWHRGDSEFEETDHLQSIQMQTIELNRWMTLKLMEVAAFQLIWFLLHPLTYNMERQRTKQLLYNKCSLWMLSKMNLKETFYTKVFLIHYKMNCNVLLTNDFNGFIGIDFIVICVWKC